MPSVKVTFGNSLRNFTLRTDRLAKGVSKKIEKAIDREVNKLVRILERKSRRDTGRLRRGWRAIPRSTGKNRHYVIVNKVPYGVYTTEKGTGSTVAKGGTPLTQMVERELQKAERRLRRTVNGILFRAALNFNRD